ncbi:predicted protein [Scheffersomyces stipitis CBS 6054]|uniref:DUF1279 domain-containing protein n=1 Tax=Scheffersomyces stipitis (strain ATCC 58785 / CBS 6054 / NBRC 10063 / NRRL Y-11545) TaxID=322104 RepID=A3LMZ5_PICST|nr:predicted protein [Scheffersomyces stipitis CBS 6054]ABN64241.2 predicted protein [Scheffersomyces stipitis CBS 6054]KAG2736265.1 hypothetical protein G9P44_000355 [Scheffersomyces stipitis]
MLRFNRMRAPIFRPSSILTRFNGSLLRNQVFKRFQSIKTSTNAGSSQNPSGKKATGIKALMKEYGFSALAVYLSISAIDLPLCYLLVHSMGKDEIEFYENRAKQTFGFGVSDEELAQKQELARNQEKLENVDVAGRSEGQGIFSYLWSQFSWTEFAIAYGVHKSLIFIRVPITAAITPGIVRALRRWGFKIGSDKLATTATIAKENIKDFTASSSKFGTRPKNKKWFWFF